MPRSLSILAPFIAVCALLALLTEGEWQMMALVFGLLAVGIALVAMATHDIGDNP